MALAGKLAELADALEKKLISRQVHDEQHALILANFSAPPSAVASSVPASDSATLKKKGEISLVFRRHFE